MTVQGLQIALIEAEEKVKKLEAELEEIANRDCTIQRICSSCNKTFHLWRVAHSRSKLEAVSSFEKCPHCNARNDIWVKISWPKPEKK
jgi:DNA-directed RNA polymerase subunit M/transcription elongation factor TFIIS